MQQEKWWEGYKNKMYEGYINMDDIPALLQEHTEQIIKEIEGMKIPSILSRSVNNQVHNAALDAVINHLKKEI